MLDSCEHVIGGLPRYSPAKKSSGHKSAVHILATSREALRVEDERVHRLPPLNFPASTRRLKAADALGFPSIQLFVERAAASVWAPLI